MTCPICKSPLINYECNNFITNNENTPSFAHIDNNKNGFTHFSVEYDANNNIDAYFLCLYLNDKFIEINYSINSNLTRIYYNKNNKMQILTELNFFIDPYDNNLINKLKTIINFS